MPFDDTYAAIQYARYAMRMLRHVLIHDTIPLTPSFLRCRRYAYFYCRRLPCSCYDAVTFIYTTPH